MESLILNFLLLVLRISLDFNPNTSYKGAGFFEFLLEKDLEFVLNKRNNIIVFNLDLILLPTKSHPILEKRVCKKKILGACDIGYVEMIFVLLTKVVILHMRATIV